MKITLISLFHYDNFAMRLLFSHLKANGISVSFIGFKRMRHKVTKTLKNDFMEMNDYHTNASREDIDVLLGELEKQTPDLVGIGLQSGHFPVAKEITEAIRERIKAPIIWGGAHPTVDPESCIKHADMICVNEGVEALLELCQRIEQGKPYDDVRNIWINRAGRITKNPTRPLLANLDILPPASFDNESKIYIDEGRLQPERNIDYFGYSLTDEPFKTIHQTMTAFGCPMHCSFCMNALADNHHRRRSVSHVMKELIDAKKKNPRLLMIFFWDNIFQVNKKWCLEFAKEYGEKIGLPFFTYTHPSFDDEEVFVALRKAGWVVTNMGIQSGSRSFRREVYARNETNGKILETARRLDKLRKIKKPWPVFRIYYDYVKNNPLENKEDLKESLDLILKLPKDFVFQAFNLSFFPNYVLTKVFLEKGLITEADIEGNVTGSGNNWISTFDKAKEYDENARMHEYYYLLFSLAQFRFFPNFLIRKIEKKKMFYRHLHVLYWVCKIVRVVDLALNPSIYLWLYGMARVVSVRSKIKHWTFFRYK